MKDNILVQIRGKWTNTKMKKTRKTGRQRNRREIDRNERKAKGIENLTNEKIRIGTGTEAQIRLIMKKTEVIENRKNEVTMSTGVLCQVRNL